MRILFLTNMYPPHDVGGYEQICQEVTDGLKGRGHEITILTSRFGVDPAGITSQDGVSRTLHLQGTLNYYQPVDFFLRRSSKEKFNLLKLQKTIDEFRPDIVFVWGMWLLSLNLPYWIEQWMPGRIVYYIASYWPMDEDPHTAYWRLPARRYITEQFKKPLRQLAFSRLRREKYPPALLFNRTLCCSEYVRDKLVDAAKLPASADVLHIGIDPKPFAEFSKKNKPAENETLHLIYFGRLIEDKGAHTAVEAVGLLKQRGFSDQIELTILGSGHPDYEARLHNLISEFGIAGQVKFIGKIPREEIPSLLSKFDVFLFTSIWPEPFGRTIIEAMLAGLIVIGSDVGGSREIFNDYDNDLLFPAGDANALASRITLLLDGAKDKQQLVQFGRKLALEHFSLNNMIDGIEEYIFATLKLNQKSS